MRSGIIIVLKVFLKYVDEINLILMNLDKIKWFLLFLLFVFLVLFENEVEFSKFSGEMYILIWDKIRR